jgi:predicted ATPase
VPSAKLLVTSRRPLRLNGEREFPLSPLPIPSENTSPHDLEQNASVRLFCDRARAVRPDFRLTDSNAADVREVCRRLDGIPLALELAAARHRALSPKQIVTQLESGLGPFAACRVPPRCLPRAVSFSRRLTRSGRRRPQ